MDGKPVVPPQGEPLGLRQEPLVAALGDSIKSITKLSGNVELVAPGSLPNDGKVIEDARTYQ